jgi:hypothetical protein
LKPHEVNYLVHDLELSIIVFALRVWLLSLDFYGSKTFEVFNVTKGVEYMEKKMGGTD